MNAVHIPFIKIPYFSKWCVIGSAGVLYIHKHTQHHVWKSSSEPDSLIGSDEKKQDEHFDAITL